MKELTLDLLSSLVKGDLQQAQVVVLSRQGLGHRAKVGGSSGSLRWKYPLSPNKSGKKAGRTTSLQYEEGGEERPQKHLVCPGVTLVDASSNVLREADHLFDVFPAAWWMNLSNNGLTTINPDAWPLYLGSLDLSNNNLRLYLVLRLSGRHILRLKLASNPLMRDLLGLMKDPVEVPPEDSEASDEQKSERAMAIEKRRRHGRLCLLANIPNVWVLDDDFCAFREKRLVVSAAIVQDPSILSTESVPAMDETGVDATTLLPDANINNSDAEVDENSLAHDRGDEDDDAAQMDEMSATGTALGLIEFVDNENDDEDIHAGELESSSLLSGGSSVSLQLPQRLSINNKRERTPNKDGVSSLALFSRGQTQLNWGTRQPSERESILMTAVQSLPTGDPSGALSDAAKLDILLEDYLAEARTWNAAAMASLDKMTRQPSIDLMLLLYLPHAIKLDLSVLLTTSIVFTIPRLLLVDALVAMLSPHSPMSVVEIEEMVSLPAFCRTALVSLLRRMARQERAELKLMKALSEKPSRSRYPHLRARANLTAAEERDLPVPPPATYQPHHSNPWVFLQPIQDFLRRPLGSNESSSSSGQLNSAFTDIEEEILRNLPDVPTMATKPINPATSYRDWLAFASRHAVLLLAKSQLCPSLTRGQVSTAKQEMYKKLLPVLSAASMTYKDLELQTTGPFKDGRLNPYTGEPLTSSTIGGSVLEFGAGLPKSGPTNLLWNQSQLNLVRGYLTPWSDYLKTRTGTGTDTSAHVFSEERADSPGSVHGGSSVKVLIQRTSSKDSDGSVVKPKEKEQALHNVDIFTGRQSSPTTGRRSKNANQHSSEFDYSGFVHVDSAQTSNDPISAPQPPMRKLLVMPNNQVPESCRNAGGLSPNSRGNLRQSRASIHTPTTKEYQFDGSLGATDPYVLVDSTVMQSSPKLRGGQLEMDFPESPKSLQQNGEGSLDLPENSFNLSEIDVDTSKRDSRGGIRVGGSRGGKSHGGSRQEMHRVPPGGGSGGPEIDFDSIDGMLMSPAEQHNGPPFHSQHQEYRRGPDFGKRKVMYKKRAFPLHPTKVVNAFAADAAWDAAFLLAPPETIQQHNQREPRDERWSSLDEVPVLLHPAGMQNVPGILDSNDVDDDKSLPSLMSSSSQSGPRDPAKETPAAAARRLLAEMGTLRNIRKMKSGGGGSLGISPSLVGDALGESVSGTFSMGNIGGSSWSHHSTGQSHGIGLEQSLSAPTLHPSLGALLLSRGPAVPVSSASLDSNLYLTALPESRELESLEELSAGQGLMSLSTDSYSSQQILDIQRGPSKVAIAEEQHTANLRRSLTNSLSSTELMRMTSKYPHLYSHGTVKSADVATSGRVLAGAWFPKYTKVVYTLDKKTVPYALLRMSRAESTLLQNGQKERASRERDRDRDHEQLTPSLFQNSELSLAAPAGTRVTPLDFVRPRDPEDPTAATDPVFDPAMTDRHESLPGSRGSTFSTLDPSADRRPSRSLPTVSSPRMSDAVKSRTPQHDLDTMTDSLVGCTTTSAGLQADSREDVEGTHSLSLTAPSLVFSSPFPTLSPVIASRLAKGGHVPISMPRVPKGPVGGGSEERKETDQDVSEGLEDGVKEKGADVGTGKNRSKRPVAAPLREPVYRVDAFEQRDTPLRAKILSVPQPASARLHLNSSFRITRKPTPQPVVVARQAGETECSQIRDSIVKFDAGGRPQI